jgi:hypothetical protein
MTGTPEISPGCRGIFFVIKNKSSGSSRQAKTLIANPKLAARGRPVLRSVLKEMLDVR